MSNLFVPNIQYGFQFWFYLCCRFFEEFVKNHGYSLDLSLGMRIVFLVTFGPFSLSSTSYPIFSISARSSSAALNFFILRSLCLSAIISLICGGTIPLTFLT